MWKRPQTRSCSARRVFFRVKNLDKQTDNSEIKTMIFNYSGNAVNPNTVSYRSLGFEEKVTVKTQPYILQIKPGDFPRELEIIANTFISECGIDDSEQDDVDIPELATVDYPTSNELLNTRPNLTASLIEELYFELFYHFFSKPNQPTTGHQQHQQRMYRERYNNNYGRHIPIQILLAEGNFPDGRAANSDLNGRLLNKTDLATTSAS